MQKSKGGFTLIELIVVIVILGIIGVGTANFIGLGANLYVDAVGREQVVSQTRYAMERITREIREALPNSVRVGSVGNVHCIEFVPIQASSTYVNVPVSPEASSDSVQLVSPPVAVIDDGQLPPIRIAVYPLSANDVYETESTTGRVFSIKAATSVVGGYTSVALELGNEVLFDADSPTGRYYIVEEAVSYCVNTATGQMFRYDSYWPSAAQEVPTNDVVGVLMAENFKTGSIPFTYAGATLLTNAIVQLNFEIERAGETVSFYHEVHLVNVP